jgi:hypothetical protein
MGLINELTTPITTAATIADQKESSLNPGTKYATTSKAKTVIASFITSFIA